MADDFIDDMDIGGDQEASLDDFFQPTSSEEQSKGQEPSVDDFFAPPSPDGKADLPLDPAMPDQAPPPAAAAPPPMPTEAMMEDEPGEAKGPGFVKRNLLWIIIGVVVVALGAGGAYFAMTTFLKPGLPEITATPVKPAKKPSPKKPAAPVKPEKPAPAPEKPGGGKDTGTAPAGSANKKPAKEPAAVKTPGPTPAKTPEPEPKPPANKPPPKPAEKPSPSPVVKSTGGPYVVQVGAYMLEASKVEPEKKLKELGYTDFRYDPLRRTIKIYHVLVGENLTREKAVEIMNRLSDIGYKPELVKEPSGYKVLAYSYGSYQTAKGTRTKIQKAGLSPVTIKSETKAVTMDQLQVGGYKNRTEANKVLRQLKKSGFPGAIVVKK